jgi:hypothetical protein
LFFPLGSSSVPLGPVPGIRYKPSKRPLRTLSQLR